MAATMAFKEGEDSKVPYREGHSLNDWDCLRIQDDPEPSGVRGVFDKGSLFSTESAFPITIR